MKVCYVDESGNQTADRCLVMVGIVVDAARLRRTRDEFATVFDDVQRLFQDNLKELKGSKMIFGRDRWRNVDPQERKRIGDFLCNWVADRKHQLVIAAIDRERFSDSDAGSLAPVGDDPWLVAGLHTALQLQKHHQGKGNNKGQTFLFFDENKQKADRLAELLFAPPVWSDAYYDRKKKQAQLDQLIDSAFTVKSHHAGLVQVADLYALVFRRYAEFHDYSAVESWEGERELIDGYAATLAKRLLPRATRWPKNSTCECNGWYTSVTPPSLTGL